MRLSQEVGSRTGAGFLLGTSLHVLGRSARVLLPSTDAMREVA